MKGQRGRPKGTGKASGNSIVSTPAQVKEPASKLYSEIDQLRLAMAYEFACIMTEKFAKYVPDRGAMSVQLADDILNALEAKPAREFIVVEPLEVPQEELIP